MFVKCPLALGIKVLELSRTLTQWIDVPQKTSKLVDTIFKGTENNMEYSIVV